MVCLVLNLCLFMQWNEVVTFFFRSRLTDGGLWDLDVDAQTLIKMKKNNRNGWNMLLDLEQHRMEVDDPGESSSLSSSSSSDSWTRYVTLYYYIDILFKIKTQIMTGRFYSTTSIFFDTPTSPTQSLKENEVQLVDAFLSGDAYANEETFGTTPDSFHTLIDGILRLDL